MGQTALHGEREHTVDKTLIDEVAGELGGHAVPRLRLRCQLTKDRVAAIAANFARHAFKHGVPLGHRRPHVRSTKEKAQQRDLHRATPCNGNGSWRSGPIGRRLGVSRIAGRLGMSPGTSAVLDDQQHAVIAPKSPVPRRDMIGGGVMLVCRCARFQCRNRPATGLRSTLAPWAKLQTENRTASDKRGAIRPSIFFSPPETACVR